jgi:glutathione-regulated potassium-efflux system ancillary protein KefG
MVMPKIKKILILFAHPAYKRSKINAALRGAIEALDGVTVHDLYARYPDFLIDVAKEQQLCLDHDVLILQHPFYWYSTPAIITEWLDLVLEHGWAYGTNGSALEGKIFFQALTAGGDSAAYSAMGSNRYTLRELTLPLRATANLCRMHWLPPYAVLGAHRGLHSDELAAHVSDYRRTILALRDDDIDLERAASFELLNSDLASLIGGE